MFDALLIRLRDDFGAIGKILRLNDHVTKTYYSPGSPAQWAPLRESDPGKLRWEIYNQSAALTRLYAVYSAFIEDLVREYLLVLPDLYETYKDLPKATVTQHRLGLGQILQKLGNEGSYADLNEAELIIQVSRGFAGERPYSLIPEAFLIDRQNYRLDPLGRVLSYLGFEKAADRLSQHPTVKSCIDEKWAESTTLRAELKRFVDLRNLAAHSELEDIVSLDELLSISDLLLCVCGAAADILSRELLQRQLSLKRLRTIGEVLETYHKRTVAIAKMKPCRLSVDDEVVLLAGNRVYGTAKICSIQDMGQDLRFVEPRLDQEIGLRFDQKCRRGMCIAQVVRTYADEEQLEMPFAEGPSTQTQEGNELGAAEPEDTDE